MTPLAGRVARLQTVISATTVNHEFEDWDMSLQSDMIEVNGFEKVADEDSNQWNSYLAGLCGGEAKFGGIYNSSKTPTNAFRQGNAFIYTSLYCGLTSAIGYTLTGKCKSIEAGTQIKKAGTFKGVFQIEGVTTYPS